MSAILSLLFSRAGIVGMILVGLVTVFGVQELRLKLAQHGEASAKADASTSKAGLKLSEDKRAVEYSQAVGEAGDAETQCAARVAAAAKSGTAIHAIVSKPYVPDPKSGCPLRAIVGARELRDAIQP